MFDHSCCFRLRCNSYGKILESLYSNTFSLGWLWFMEDKFSLKLRRPTLEVSANSARLACHKSIGTKRCKKSYNSTNKADSADNHWLVVWLPFFIFPYIGNVIIPIDVHIFQRGGPTTNQIRVEIANLVSHLTLQVDFIMLKDPGFLHGIFVEFSSVCNWHYYNLKNKEPPRTLLEKHVSHRWLPYF